MNIKKAVRMTAVASSLAACMAVSPVAQAQENYFAPDDAASVSDDVSSSGDSSNTGRPQRGGEKATADSDGESHGGSTHSDTGAVSANGSSSGDAKGQSGSAGGGILGVSDVMKMAEIGKEEARVAGRSGDIIGGKNIVAFGDSYFADSATPGTNGKCGQSDTNPPKLMGKKVGLPVDDYSCSGATATDATSNNFGSQVGLALKHKVLTPETQYVVISMGGNDGIAGVWAPADAQYKSYYTSMKEQIERIKKAAPNAKILQVGYPEIVNDNGELCPIHTSAGNMVKLPGDFVKSQEYLINTHQQMVADKLGITFLDIKNSTKGHGLCAPDNERWVSGYADSSVQSTYTMPLHLTAKANEHISNVLADATKGIIPERSKAKITREAALSPGGIAKAGNQLMNILGTSETFGKLGGQFGGVPGLGGGANAGGDAQGNGGSGSHPSGGGTGGGSADSEQPTRDGSGESGTESNNTNSSVGDETGGQ